MIALAGGEDLKCAEYATFGTEELSNNVIKALEERRAVSSTYLTLRPTPHQ